jgi:NAD(P)-dependent dehydrogenase (short-subunit alcohol dehydrogenase family)
MSFGVDTTAAEAIAGTDLHGRTAVITGASGGIGLETARAFASAGAVVILGNRQSAKSDAAAAELRADQPDAAIEVINLDLTSLASVRAFAQEVSSRHDRIDLLVNNAGVMATPLERTSDGFELQFGTNHLGHFLLTKLLMPSLLRADSPRIVNLTSNGHAISDVIWDDPNYRERPYTDWESYGQSKTANVLFTVELQRRFGSQGLQSFAVHPGVVGTDLFRYLSDEGKARLDRQIAKNNIFYKTPQQGASTSVWAATAPELKDQGGAYLEDCRVSEKVSPYAQSPESAERLWAMSEELVGEPFPS